MQRNKGMATRRVDCEYLSQVFTNNEVELTLPILNNEITSCESEKERLKGKVVHYSKYMLFRKCWKIKNNKHHLVKINCSSQHPLLNNTYF